MTARRTLAMLSCGLAAASSLAVARGPSSLARTVGAAGALVAVRGCWALARLCCTAGASTVRCAGLALSNALVAVRGRWALALVCGTLAVAADPVRTAWIMSATPMSGTAAPEVHSVEIGEREVTVRSAGISLKYFGVLQQAPVPSERLREFIFHIPLHPEPAPERHARVPLGAMGVFLNGLPIYNQFETLSWDGANIWHYDAVAANDDGTLTSAGHPRRDLTHQASPGLLDQLAEDRGRHSPLLGFALDGYPVYGPWGVDGNGGLHRMRSGYRLREISRRESLPDGTQLTPAQYGPEVNSEAPLGMFAEDYEYAAGTGDLDEFNGRRARTPEYPEGTYAYFLATDAAGRLAFPYLMGLRFYGRVTGPGSAVPEEGRADAGVESGSWHTIGIKRVELAVSTARVEAGREVRFRMVALDSSGESTRHLEWVHERPVHMLIASQDLFTFAHIHPELTAVDTYEVAHTFPRGGRYRIWLDYSLPGESPRVEEFDLDVGGAAYAPRPLTESPVLARTGRALTVKLSADAPLRAGEDIPLTLSLSGALESLQPYLGAWAHVIVIGERWKSFAHAHPLEATDAGYAHTHVAGPVPSAVHIVTNFPTPGLYKLWAQFQQAGDVLTVPFVVRVAAGEPQRSMKAVPAGTISIKISQRGYTPARIEIPAGKPVKLAFTRDRSANCGGEIVFPTLGIRKTLPAGQTTVIALPAQEAGEIGFACGMGMYRGMMVAR